MSLLMNSKYSERKSKCGYLCWRRKKDGDNDTSTFNVAGRMRAERKQNLYGNLTNFITTFIKYIIFGNFAKRKGENI